MRWALGRNSTLFNFLVISGSSYSDFETNVTKGVQFHNATGLTSDTEYKIGTRTVDSAGKINEIWVNHTARTKNESAVASIAILNPDNYRTLKAGYWPGCPDYVEPENRTVYSRAYTLDGVSHNGSGADVGTQPDFLYEILIGHGYNVDVYNTSTLPVLSPSDYDLLIIQDPLTEVNKAWNFSHTNKTPDLRDIFRSSSTRDNVLNYYNAGGKLLLGGDAVQLLEDETGDGIYTLNFGKEIKTKQTENNIPFDGYGESRDGHILDNWVLTIGCPFCCADRSASATYYANSSTWGMDTEILGEISLFDGHDLIRQAFSYTVYYPTDAISVLDVHVIGSGNFDLDSSTCSPTVYTYGVDDHLNKFMGYTECDGGRIYYLGSDSYWDYKYITYDGSWHCHQNMYIDFNITNTGEIAFLNLVEGALNYSAAPPPENTWYLHNNSTMYRTTTNPAGNLTIATSSFNLWIADEPAQINLSFPAGIWTGGITLETALPPGQNFSIEVGNCSGGIFTASGSDTINGDGNTSFDFRITADSFSISKNDYLAVNITNATTDIEVKTGGTHSYITSPDTAPAYPIPELPSIFLFTIGLLMLAGFVRRRR
jgi:hypothetical protein